MRIALTLFLWASVSLANDLHVVNGYVQTLTNIATFQTPNNLSAYAWWEPERGYFTNGTLTVLSNLTSIGTAFDLTNSGIVNPTKQVANLNGFTTLGFLGTATGVLKCENYTVPNGATQEVFMVLSVTNFISRAFFGSLNVTNERAFSLNNTPAFVMKSGSSFAASRVITNRYVVVDLLFASGGSSSRIYTNNIAGVNLNLTPTNIVGMLLGRDNTFTNGVFSLASMFTFTNQLTTAQRTAAFQYCSNRFNTASP